VPQSYLVDFAEMEAAGGLAPHDQDRAVFLGKRWRLFLCSINRLIFR
jgi:hypothetical protein